MIDEEEEKVIGEEEEENDYIKTIEELKKNSVSKEEFKKLKEENKRLLDTVINGGGVVDEKPREIDVKKIEEKLRSRDPRITSLEGVKMALDLREADMREGKRDPFVSVNNHTPTKEDFEKAEARAEVYRECIEYADGDPNLFAQELSRRMVDNFSPKFIKRR